MRLTLWLLLAGCTGPDDPVELVDPFTVESLGAATRAQTDLGARLVATPAEDEARAAVESAFADAGLLDVRSEPFTWDAWVPGPSWITVGDRTWEAQPLSPSASGESDLVLASADGDFGDAAVLMSSDAGSRAEQFLTALSGGAEALIRITEDVGPDGTPLVEVGHTLDGSKLLSVAVDKPTGEALRALVGQTATVRVDSDVEVGHVSYNVLGEVAGTGFGTVYVTAHYDSWHPSESAFDNALGTAFQVLLARKLAQGPAPEKTVVFLATSGEEQGLQGAFAWTDANPTLASAASYVLNQDVPWSAEGSYLCAASDGWVRELALEAASAEGIEAVDVGVPGLGSDQFAFMVRGAPAAWCERWRDRHYHTTEDRLEHIDLDEALAALRVQWALLSALAGVPEDDPV